MHRHGSLRDTAETYARDVLAIGPDDVTFSVAKFFFAYGLGNTMTFPFSVGASHRARPVAAQPGGHAADPAGAPADAVLRRARPTTPRCSRAGLPEDAFAGVRACVSAGEAFPAALLERFTATFGVEMLDGIGSTEMLHIFISNRPGPRPRRHQRRGRRRLRGQDRQDDDGAPGARRHPRPPLRAGQLGGHRLLVPHRGHPPGVPGRRGCAPATPTSASADGYFASMGRTDDIIKAGGIWVSPTEVEERLRQHPDVNLVVVVSLPDADGLDKPVACVVLAPGSRHDRRRAGRLLPRGPGRVQAARATSWSSTSCRPPPRASCSASASAELAPRPAQRPDRRRPRVTATDTLPPQSAADAGRAVEVDLLVVGAGPAGLYAAYYAGFRGLRTAIVDSLPGARRPGDGALPGEDGLRRRRLPRDQGPRPGRRAGRAGRPLRPGLRARRAGRAPHQRGRAPPARRRPARRHHRQGHPDHAPAPSSSPAGSAPSLPARCPAAPSGRAAA